MRLARGDLALAGALTGLFPVLSAFVTPLICEITLRPVLGAESVKFRIASTLFLLVSTITFPLGAGVALRHLRPSWVHRLLKPIQTFSEGAGAIALAYIIFAQFQFMRETKRNELFAMLISSELCFFLGYAVSGPNPAARLVAGLGTANRNIALAVLIAAQSFPGSAIAGAVVTNGLLLILVGLAHVGLWRLFMPHNIRD